jgi:hypothetical protein
MPTSGIGRICDESCAGSVPRLQGGGYGRRLGARGLHMGRDTKGDDSPSVRLPATSFSPGYYIAGIPAA